MYFTLKLSMILVLFPGHVTIELATDSWEFRCKALFNYSRPKTHTILSSFRFKQQYPTSVIRPAHTRTHLASRALPKVPHFGHHLPQLLAGLLHGRGNVLEPVLWQLLSIEREGAEGGGGGGLRLLHHFPRRLLFSLFSGRGFAVGDPDTF